MDANSQNNYKMTYLGILLNLQKGIYHHQSIFRARRVHSVSQKCDHAGEKLRITTSERCEIEVRARRARLHCCTKINCVITPKSLLLLCWLKFVVARMEDDGWCEMKVRCVLCYEMICMVGMFDLQVVWILYHIFSVCSSKFRMVTGSIPVGSSYPTLL
jgi:hypothetical protein